MSGSLVEFGPGAPPVQDTLARLAGVPADPGRSADARRWSRTRLLLWSVATYVCVFLLARGFLEHVAPRPGLIVDFYQEWLSARNLLSARRVYAPVRESFAVHTGHDLTAAPLVWDRNVHPPSSVLLAVPFALLEYPQAFLAWNIASLAALAASVWLVVRGLGVPWHPGLILPATCLLLTCEPLRHSLFQGQLNLVLLVLLTGAWFADRRGRPVLAGGLVGTATAIKLFPAFFLAYFVFRRDGRAVVSAVLTLVLVTAATLLCCGRQPFDDYAREVLPTATLWRGSFTNCSLTALWCKLFAPTGHHGPVQAAPGGVWLATVMTLGTLAVVLGAVARKCWTARSHADADAAFALAVVGMLLVSPVTWDHYFVLLLLPLVVAGRHVRGRTAARAVYLAATGLIWLPTIRLSMALCPDALAAATATPLHTLAVLSLPCYALLALFIVLAAPRVPSAITVESTAAWTPAISTN
jgi:hypothetical protein